jgi:hypothetical protein
MEQTVAGLFYLTSLDDNVAAAAAAVAESVMKDLPLAARLVSNCCALDMTHLRTSHHFLNSLFFHPQRDDDFIQLRERKKNLKASVVGEKKEESMTVMRREGESAGSLKRPRRSSQKEGSLFEADLNNKHEKNLLKSLLCSFH